MEYNDCLSNSQLGYLYAVERSAYCGYIGNHVKNYVKFMIRVSIICAINTSNEVRQICKESHLQVVYIDADEYIIYIQIITISVRNRISKGIIKIRKTKEQL